MKDRFKIPMTKVVIIPGVISARNYPMRKVFTKQRSEIKLVNISRFERRKGHEGLLEAVSILLQKGYNIHLTIRGPISGEILPVLKCYEELRLADHVTILYTATIEERRSLLEQSDLFVLPSLELETFGLSMIEALASSVPVIGTPIGAIPEVLSLIDPRLITKSTRPSDLAHAIEWFIKLRLPEKRQLAQKCRTVALTTYDQSHILPRLEGLYCKQ